MDRISDLPGELLSHICGYLDMKERVRTSLVAKRWRYVWISNPNLLFYHTLWRKKTKPQFMDFVDKALSLWEGSPIHSFSLRGSKYDRVDKWLANVINCNVQEIRIELSTVLLPRFLFISSTHLRKLDLVSADLPNDREDLELSLPVLETLILRKCSHAGLKSFYIDAPQLQKMLVSDPSWEFSCKLKIRAPRLDLLEFIACVYKEYLIQNVSSHLRVKLSRPDITMDNLLVLLTSLANAEAIDVYDISVENNVYHPNPKREEDFSPACMVRNLGVQDITGSDDELEFLGTLLENCPYMETLSVTTVFARKGDLRKEFADFGKKLHSLPRASPDVRVNFIVQKNRGLSHRG